MSITKEGSNENSVDPRQPYRVCAIPGCATRLRPWLNGSPHEVPTTQVDMNVERWHYLGLAQRWPRPPLLRPPPRTACPPRAWHPPEVARRHPPRPQLVFRLP